LPETQNQQGQAAAKLKIALSQKHPGASSSAGIA